MDNSFNQILNNSWTVSCATGLIFLFVSHFVTRCLEHQRQDPEIGNLKQQQKYAKDELLYSLYHWLDAEKLPSPFEIKELSRTIAKKYKLPRKYVLSMKEIRDELLPYIAQTPNLSLDQKQTSIKRLYHLDAVTFTISRSTLEHLLIFLGSIFLFELIMHIPYVWPLFSQKFPSHSELVLCVFSAVISCIVSRLFTRIIFQ